MMALPYLCRGVKVLFRQASGMPPGFEESLSNTLVPKHIMESLESYFEHPTEVEPRPQIPELNLHMIQYNKEKKLYENIVVNAKSYFTPKRCILIGIIGAFVPECTCEVIYEWARAAAVFKEEFDFDDITIVSMNDPFVMEHFAKKLDYEDRVNYIADWDGKLNDLMKCRYELDLELGHRNYRYAAFVMNNSLQVVQSSGWNKLFFMKMIHPIYMWQNMKNKHKRALYFC